MRRDARLGRRRGDSRATVVIGELVERCWDVIVVGAGLGGGIAGRRLAEKGLSVLFVESGPATPREDWNGWTAATDDPETLNYRGMAEVGAVATDLVRALAMTTDRPTYVKAAPPKLSEGARGYGPYFGSIPDFGEQSGGVLLAGVRDGSPAAKAGIQKGDVIVKFGEYDIANLQDLTIALREHAPGDEVVVVYTRGGKRIETKAVLTKRE